MAKQIDSETLRGLAIIGAELQAATLATRREQVLEVLALLQARSVERKGHGVRVRPRKGTRVAGKRKRMSPAQRAAVGERMRAYWAQRRKLEAGRKLQRKIDRERKAAEIKRRKGEK